MYGDSTQSCLVGVVVPKEKALMAWAAENNVPGDFAAVCTSAAANAAVLAAMNATGKTEKLNSLEMVKAIELVTEQVRRPRTRRGVAGIRRGLARGRSRHRHPHHQ